MINVVTHHDGHLRPRNVQLGTITSQCQNPSANGELAATQAMANCFASDSNWIFCGV